MKLHFQTLFVAIGLGIKRNGHIFLAIILGILLGNWIHNNPDKYQAIVSILDVLGQAFIRIIQMVVIPLVISAIVIGIYFLVWGLGFRHNKTNELDQSYYLDSKLVPATEYQNAHLLKCSCNIFQMLTLPQKIILMRFMDWV